jgi:hypothetical protein
MGNPSNIAASTPTSSASASSSSSEASSSVISTALEVVTRSSLPSASLGSSSLFIGRTSSWSSIEGRLEEELESSSTLCIFSDLRFSN